MVPFSLQSPGRMTLSRASGCLLDLAVLADLAQLYLAAGKHRHALIVLEFTERNLWTMLPDRLAELRATLVSFLGLCVCVFHSN